MKKHHIQFLVWTLPLVIAFSASSVFADEAQRGFDATVGAMYGYGQLGDSGLGLNNRSMGVEQIELLPGYRLNEHWLLGVDFNYEFQQQWSSLASAGGTNLSGHGWLLGVGANYRLDSHWSFQGAIDFLGQYQFNHQTDQAQDDHLASPVALTLKGQYHFSDRLPLSADGVVGYQRWANFDVSGVDNSQSASEWIVGVGLTFYLGESLHRSSDQPEAVASEPQQSPQPQPQAAAPAAPVVEEKQETPTPGALVGERTSEGTKYQLSAISFKPESAELTSDSKEAVANLAKSLSQASFSSIEVRGYTDSSGRAAKNQKLSEARAQAVKQVLVDSGVGEDKVTAKGFGSSNPIESNDTSEGRAKNRRVEILVHSS
jgi:outer membrane protein OmpA-like peptidoglycan-associated protein